MSYFGLPVDAWECATLINGGMTRAQFISNFTPLPLKGTLLEVHDGTVYVWRSKRSRKPWEKTAKDHRASPEYKAWRLAVFTRDNFTCQDCGTLRENIQAHHIKTFLKHPDLRFEVSNGITLCKPCHTKQHRRGNNAVV